MLVSHIFHQRGVFLASAKELIRQARVPNFVNSDYYYAMINAEHKIVSSTNYQTINLNTSWGAYQAHHFNTYIPELYYLEKSPCVADRQKYTGSLHNLLRDYQYEIDFYSISRVISNKYGDQLNFHTSFLGEDESLLITMSPAIWDGLYGNGKYSQKFSGDTHIDNVIESVKTFLRSRKFEIVKE